MISKYEGEEASSPSHFSQWAVTLFIHHAFISVLLFYIVSCFINRTILNYCCTVFLFCFTFLGPLKYIRQVTSFFFFLVFLFNDYDIYWFLGFSKIVLVITCFLVSCHLLLLSFFQSFNLPFSNRFPFIS